MTRVSPPVPAGSAAAVDDLTAVLPRGRVLTDPDILESYRMDRAPDLPAGTPAAVIRARSTSEVQTVMRTASRRSVPVVPRGAGAGLHGGANAIDGGLILSLEHMRSVVDLDPVDRLCVVEPGIMNLALKHQLAEDGFWYPPDPASMAFCSIGGNIATNAGGLCCVKYGVTRDWVASLEVVMADGTLISTGARTIKSVAGYDLTSLLVGSEGTLGVVTQATLRICPRPPAASTLVAFFDDIADAGRAVGAVCQGAVPSLLEIMDKATIGAVEAWQRMDLDTDAAALLLIQTDLDFPARADHIAAIEKACETHGASYVARTDEPDEGEALLQARRMALPAIEQRGVALLEDVGVTRSRVPELISRTEAVARRRGVDIYSYGHAGDGNMHPTLCWSANDADEKGRAMAAFDDILDAALDLGGTITGEHGVGVLKDSWLEREVGGASIQIQQRIKDALDPDGILNPGKMALR
ncbi:FAD-binding oxidoreductase [Euzebya tangerina]|uniref:FAD-binding oxidoreductase n=1 Tax=Euzebya tangerina TaxID=591198 RepID=UPI000E3218B5|nr:FAD-linked oxidase C-terminal domain-containing protein [Euzebya tangerina]